MAGLSLKKDKKKLLALALVSIMVATAISIPFIEEETEDSEAVSWNNLSDVWNAIKDYEILGIPAYNYIGGYGGVTFYLLNDSDSSGSDSNDAETVYDVIDNVFDQYLGQDDSGNGLLVTVQETIGFSSSYFMRMSEVACAETWTSGGTIDYDNILVNSQTYDFQTKEVMNYANIFSSGFDYSMNSSSLGHSFQWGSTTSAISGTEDIVTLGMGTIISSSSADSVYIYSGSTDGYSYIYVYGGSAVITDSEGQTYTLNEGYNDLEDVPSGVYDLQTGRTYVGSFVGSNSSDKATVNPGAVLKTTNGLTYVVETSDSNSTVKHGSNTYTVTTPIYLNITDSDSTAQVSISRAFEIIRGIYGATENLVDDCLTDASATWQIFNTAGEASVFVSPSALIPNLANMDFTDAQAYLIYMSALQQMSEKLKAAGEKFDASDVVISEDSLDLLCYGTIYSDSTMSTALKTDVYFTPMCYERDQAILIGNTPFLQPGLAMIWVSDGNGGYMSGGLITLTSGMILSISSMLYRGTYYDNVGDGVTLKVMSLTEIKGYDVNKYHDTKVRTDYLTLALLVFGGILFVYGLITLNPKIFAAGCVILVFAWFIGPIIWSQIT